MHQELQECIDTARQARAALFSKEIDIKMANSIANHNQTIIQAHAIDLRTRIFLHEVANPRLIPPPLIEPDDPKDAGEATGTPRQRRRRIPEEPADG
jgi:hypothetical protein